MHVTLCDVGPRDGLQNEPDILAPALRADLVNRLAAARLPRVEAASFVRDDRVPQMAGAEEVAAGIEPREGTEYAGLVLNLKGYERLRETKLGRVNCTLAATESFNQRNGNMSLDQALTQAPRCSMPRWEDLVDVRTRRRPRGTSPRKTSSICWRAKASRRASTWTHSCVSPSGSNKRSGAGSRATCTAPGQGRPERAGPAAHAAARTGGVGRARHEVGGPQ